MMTMFGRKDWDFETPNQELEERVRREGLIVYEPNYKDQDDLNAQESDQDRNKKGGKDRRSTQEDEESSIIRNQAEKKEKGRGSKKGSIASRKQ